MKSFFVLLSLVLSVVVAQDIAFVNPPTSGEVGEVSENSCFEASYILQRSPLSYTCSGVPSGCYRCSMSSCSSNETC